MEKYFAHPTAIIDEGCDIGTGCRIWHFCHIMSGATIGNDCNIGQNVVISPNVTIGNGVKIQNNVSVYSGVKCEDFVFIGPSVVFTNVLNPRSEFVRKDEFRDTIIHKGATLGANSTIVCGVEIGSYAMVGAGAVITHSVADYALVVGNPARQVGWVSRAGHKLIFEQSQAVCPQTGERYELKDGVVRLIK